MCTLKLRRQRSRSCKRQEGQIVKSRDVLFVIDPRPYQEVLDQAKANLQTTDAQRRLQDADFARATRLFGRLVAGFFGPFFGHGLHPRTDTLIITFWLAQKPNGDACGKNGWVEKGR